MWWNIASYVLVFILLVLACYDDIRHGKVRNAITFPAVIGGLVINMAAGGLNGLKNSVLAILALFAITFVLYILGFFAAGDAKLIIACSAIKGFELAFGGLIYSIFTGALLLTYKLIAAKSFKLHMIRYFNFLKLTFFTLKPQKYDIDRKKAIKYAVAALAGFIIQIIYPLNCFVYDLRNLFF